MPAPSLHVSEIFRRERFQCNQVVRNTNKMNPIKFETYNNGIFEYHFYPKDNELMIVGDEHFSSNKILWEKWCNQEGLPMSYERFNISNSATCENILLYMILIRWLTIN